MQMGAAVHRVDLTDVLPFDGFAHVLDDLSVRVALLVPEKAGNGDTGRHAVPVVLVSFELTSLRDYAVELAQRHVRDVTGWGDADVWVAATHTFSAPHIRSRHALESGGRALRDANGRYLAALTDALDRATATALRRLEPVDATYASARADINVNRDRPTARGWWKGANPAGFSDKCIPVLTFRARQDGHPCAVVFTADVQSSVVEGTGDAAGPTRYVSADLAGHASRYVEERCPGCVALFLCGAAADQIPRSDATLESLGDLLGRAVGDAMDAPGTAGSPVPSPLVSQRTVAFEGQQPEDMATMRPVVSGTYAGAPERHSTIRTLAMGSFAMVGVAPELCSVTGAEIRGVSAYDGILVCTLVNGAEKYMADESCYDHFTYEARNSRFARGSAERLVLEVKRMLSTDQAKETRS